MSMAIIRAAGEGVCGRLSYPLTLKIPENVLNLLGRLKLEVKENLNISWFMSLSQLLER